MILISKLNLIWYLGGLFRSLLVNLFVLHAGDFMKYHDLKEKDALTLYEDGVGTIVSYCLP